MMAENAPVSVDLQQRLIDVEQRRLERENLRLNRQIGELKDEMQRLKTLQRLDGLLLERERGLRSKLVRDLRDLLAAAAAKRVQMRQRTEPPPADEIPFFLRSGEIYDAEGWSDPSSDTWFGRLLRK